MRRGTGRALVHLTDIRSFEDAEELVGRKVMAELHDEDAEDDLSVLVGWTLINSPQSPDYSPDAESAEQEVPLTEVGTITDFIDIPNNPCIEVETKNGTVMIPLHEDLIISLDPDSEEIIMSLPDGLLE